MVQSNNIYEIYAIRYAKRDGQRRDNFIGGDPHDGPMPMDYFIWAVRNAERTVVIDTGFNTEVAAKRNRTHLRCPIEGLSLIDATAEEVKDVVITHLHYDHVGNFSLFPNASFHIQEPEVHFATGRHMRHACLAHHYEEEDVVGIVRMNFAGRVRMHNGPVQLAPGISLHPAPGHTPGMQFVSVNTARGRVVLASDVSHYYENMESNRPFSAAYHIGEMLDAFELLSACAESPDHIIPGHDPLVLKLYPAPKPELQGIVARLDLAPSPRSERRN